MNKIYSLAICQIMFSAMLYAQTKTPQKATTKKATNVSAVSKASVANKSKPTMPNPTEINMLKHPNWCVNNTIYEVNLRQYAQDASFKNFEKELPRLKKMGVDILWFMPIHPIGEKGRKGSLGSYYAVKDYEAVSTEYGTMNDFNHLVKAIHGMGMKIIIDWVANHTSPDNVWVEKHSDYFTKDKEGNFVPPVPDWSDVIDLNYDNKNMRKAMIDAMSFWLAKVDIDGFRCDVAEMVPTDFWIECRKELDKVKPVFMLAEGEKPELHKAFDMTYTWSFYNTMKAVIKGEKSRTDIINYFDNQKKEYSANDIRMYFTSNHDENTWNATEFEAFGNAHKAVSAITATLPGMPLIYSGQESAQKKHLKFFDKDTIEWKKYENNEFYSQLMFLHKKSRALALNAKMEILDLKNDNIFAYKRIGVGEEILVIVNLKNALENYVTPKEIDGSYKDVSGFQAFLKTGQSQSLEGYQYMVLRKEIK